MMLEWNLLHVFVGIIVSFVTWISYFYISAFIKFYIGNVKQKNIYKKLIAQRQLEREQQFQDIEKRLSVDGILVTPEREIIVSLKVHELLQELKNRTFTALQVLNAYQAKALQETRKYNSVAQFILEAEQWAKELDALPERNLPLFGLPMSFKEDFCIENYDITSGLAKYIGMYEKRDGATVAALKRLGVIPFCRTNVPQSMASVICTNPIYGLTSNPCKLDRTPGGTSGGEAALIASGGSVLGMASDLGGSLRTPAHFCGIASLKTTSGRLSLDGQLRSLPSPPGLYPCVGFMAKSAEDIIVAAKAIFDSPYIHEFDPMAISIPWKEEAFSGKRLRIGYYDDSKTFPATPACKRAVNLAVDALRKQGHYLIAIPNPDTLEILRNIFQLLLTDNGRIVNVFLKNEVIDWRALPRLMPLVLTPNWIKKLTLPFATNFVSKFASLGVAASTPEEVWDLLGSRQYVTSHITRQWRGLSLDAVVAPAFPIPAMKNDCHRILVLGHCYTALYSHMDFPAGIVPVTKVNSDDMRKLANYPTNGEIILQYAKMAAQDSIGLPVGVQVVGLPWEEEKVLCVMKEIESVMKTGNS